MHRKNGTDNAFYFKQFHIHHDRSTMKVGTDGVLLGAWAEINSSENILDVGTGSGLIALMLAQRSAENAHIDAIEIDFDTYQQAVENVNASVWHKKISVFHNALQHFTTSRKYNLIVSNPPYFVNSLKTPHHKRNLSRHTDELPFATLIDRCRQLLHPDGRLCIILPPDEAVSFTKIALASNLNCIQQISVRHKASKPVERLLLEYSFLPANRKEHDLVLFDEKGKRSHKYNQLVTHFYLTN